MSLREAVLASFPDHPEIAASDFQGPEAQAWTAYARLLHVSPLELAGTIAPAFGVEAADTLGNGRIEPGIIAQVPFHFCQKHTVLPLFWKDGALVVATARPFDHDVSERLGFLVGKPIRWQLAPPSLIEDAVLAEFSREAVREAQMDADLSSLADENAVVRLGRELMSRAVRARASDLHVQPYLGSGVVRIRVDGLMRRLAVLPDSVASMLIRHLKSRSGMDSSNSQVPQDGRMSLVVDERDFELRVSSLPASRGERLVIRFLAQNQVHRLGSAGFSLAALQTIRRAATRPAGMVVFTGPTGSGKTSTLYAMLAEVNRSDINIITVENPVEYRIPGISQVEVNEKAGRTFAAALRSILRQDPDVILIGEIRDRETAEIAVQAAMTGHLVLTTLHTNDAMTAIPRLIDLGVQPSILADALVVVASQRLCRKLCEHCRVPVVEPLTPEENAFREITRNSPLYRALGCADCEFTGYRGRLPIVDIVEIHRGLRDAIATAETRLTELEKLREGGLKSLSASGSMRVISGDTTVRELVDAVGPVFWSELSAHYGAYFEKDAAESLPLNAAEGFGVLLIGRDTALETRLAPALEAEGFRLLVAGGAEEAGNLLHANEDIAFILGTLPPDDTPEQAAARLRRNREHISWARLPALVLLPPALVDAEASLHESGVMAAFLPDSVPEQALIAHIRRVQAR
jgi:type II secretory ATPase GspE/PulE/Tfp pilus assembly ATPase PilB-like protein